MSLTTPSKIRELQIKLYRKAKNEASQGVVARHPPVPRGTGVGTLGVIRLQGPLSARS
jgi:hypothetical protein